MATYIFDETPSGLVDGSNTTFTTLNPIGTLEEFYVGGAPYRDLTFDGNTVTLEDAPEVGMEVSIDYWLVDTSTDPADPQAVEYNTLEEIRNEVYYIINEYSDSTQFNQERYVDPTIRSLHMDICKGVVVSEVDGRIYKAGDLPFLRQQMPINSFPSFSPTVEITTDSTTITASETALEDVADAGYVYINGNVVRYTGKSSTQLTGVTGVTFTHGVNSIIRPLFILPPDFARPVGDGGLSYVMNGWNNVPVRYYDSRSMNTGYMNFTVVTDPNNATRRFIMIDGYDDIDDTFVFDYYSKGVTLTDDDDRCSLPDYYGKSVLAPLVAGTLLYKTEQVQEGLAKLKLGYAKLEQMYNYFAGLMKGYRNKVTTRPFSGIK